MDVREEENGIGEENEGETVREDKREEEIPLEKILESVEADDKRNIYIQYRVINNHGVMTGDDARIESIQIKDTERQKEGAERGNIFDDEGRLSAWLAENYEAYPMALIIAAAAFDTFPYAWVVQAADRLFESFSHRGDEEKKQYGITDTFSRFGAKIYAGEMNTYTGRTPVEVVRFEERIHRERTLKYIWRECPGLRDGIICWLKDYSVHKPMSMSKRAMEVIGLLACWDYYYFLNNMAGAVQKDKSISTDMIIAQTILTISREEMYRENADHLLRAFGRERRVHYLLTALFVCAQWEEKSDIADSMIERYICEALAELHQGKEGEYLKNLYDFFASGMRVFRFYEVLIESMFMRARQNLFPREKRELCELFLRLFAADISLARFEDGEDAILIKMCMIRHDIRYSLAFLWQTVWQCRYYRQVFYDLMAKYEKERGAAGDRMGYGMEEFIGGALGDICTKETQSDICKKIRRRIKG